MSTPRSITCPDCGRTSWHPADVQFGYCGACHAFTSDPLAMRLRDAQTQGRPGERSSRERPSQP